MKYFNQISGKYVHFFLGETVLYLGIFEGVIISETTVMFDDDSVIRCLKSQPHKFRLKRPLPLVFRYLLYLIRKL